MEIKTTLEICNGRITKAQGKISIEYAKEISKKKWVALDEVKDIKKKLKERISPYLRQKWEIQAEELIDEIFMKEKENLKEL